MGLAVGSKRNNEVFLAIDSSYYGVLDKDSFLNVNNYQVYNVCSRQNVYIIYQGNEKRVIDILKTQNDIFPKSAFNKHKIKLSFLINSFVPKIYDILEKHKIIDENDESNFLTGEFLVATNSQLFVIFNDGTVNEVYDFTAIGDSEAFAFGAYKALHENESDEQVLLIKTFDAVTKNSYKCRFPILIINLSENVINIISEKFTEKESIYKISV